MASTPARRRAHALPLLIVAVLLAALTAQSPPSARADEGAPSSVDGTGTDPGAGPAADPAPAATAGRRARATFKVAAFNVLGSHHTRRTTEWLSGTRRVRLAHRWLRGEGTSLVGMSEAQRGQMRVLVDRKGWSSYPRWTTSRSNETAQSVLWRPEVWKKVKARSYPIPFNNGRTRRQAVVLLEHRASDRRVWVISTHLQVGTSMRNRRERTAGARRLVREVKAIHRTGRRVLVLGDLNAHDPVFCRLSRDTSLKSPSGGSYRGGRCQPPQPRLRRIDWIFGSPDFEWKDYRVAEGRRLARITDHDVPVSTVQW